MGAALSSVLILFFQWDIDSTYAREHKFHSVFASNAKLWSTSSRPKQMLRLLGPITCAGCMIDPPSKKRVYLFRYLVP
jgi:hypothetical protein